MPFKRGTAVQKTQHAYHWLKQREDNSELKSKHKHWFLVGSCEAKKKAA
jgi:hypothetical protein